MNHWNPLRELNDRRGGRKKEKSTYQSKGSNPAISTAAQVSRVNAL